MKVLYDNFDMSSPIIITRKQRLIRWKKVLEVSIKSLEYVFKGGCDILKKGSYLGSRPSPANLNY